MGRQIASDAIIMSCTKKYRLLNLFSIMIYFLMKLIPFTLPNKSRIKIAIFNSFFICFKLQQKERWKRWILHMYTFETSYYYSEISIKKKNEANVKLIIVTVFAILEKSRISQFWEDNSNFILKYYLSLHCMILWQADKADEAYMVYIRQNIHQHRFAHTVDQNKNEKAN